MKKVFITGANGFLATHIILQLLEQGQSVHAFLRDACKMQIPKHDRLKIFEGDLFNQAAIKNAIKGCDSVIHTAAITDMGHHDKAIYFKTHVDGTRNIIEAAIAAACKRFVYVGTANSFRYKNNKYQGIESEGLNEHAFKTAYAASKTKAQKLALSYHHVIDVVCVNPSFLMGKFMNPDGAGQIIKRGFAKSILLVPKGGKNFIHVEDAANLSIQALQRGINGQSYLLVNENLTFLQFYQLMNTITERKSKIISIPSFLLKGIGIFGNLMHQLGINTSITYENMDILSKKCFYDNALVQKAFNMQFKATQKALEDSIAWINKEMSEHPASLIIQSDSQ